MNYELVNCWLAERDIVLEESFVYAIRKLAKEYKKSGNNVCDIYTSLNCSKQNLSYWERHFFSSQSRKSILKVINNAAVFFDLSFSQTENLANKAGLSLSNKENGLYELLSHYNGKLKKLYNDALISERMFNYYRQHEPTKQALLSIAITLKLSLNETDRLLHKYGYYLSHSLPNDMVIMYFLETEKHSNNRSALLEEINNVLYNMDFPLLMTRMKP